jgi:hypothetical protein
MERLIGVSQLRPGRPGDLLYVGMCFAPQYGHNPAMSDQGTITVLFQTDIIRNYPAAFYIRPPTDSHVISYRPRSNNNTFIGHAGADIRTRQLGDIGRCMYMYV